MTGVTRPGKKPWGDGRRGGGGGGGGGNEVRSGGGGGLPLSRCLNHFAIVSAWAEREERMMMVMMMMVVVVMVMMIITTTIRRRRRNSNNIEYDNNNDDNNGHRISSLGREPSPTRTPKVARAQACANQRATHRALITCNKSCATCYWLKP